MDRVQISRRLEPASSSNGQDLPPIVFGLQNSLRIFPVVLSDREERETTKQQTAEVIKLRSEKLVEWETPETQEHKNINLTYKTHIPFSLSNTLH